MHDAYYHPRARARYMGCPRESSARFPHRNCAPPEVSPSRRMAVASRCRWNEDVRDVSDSELQSSRRSRACDRCVSSNVKWTSLS